MFEHIVVGAGVNGSSAAYQLARRGKKVLLLEKVSENLMQLKKFWENIFSFLFHTLEAVLMDKVEG